MDDRGHLVSTVSVQDLHTFADHLCLSRRRFHGLRKGHPHYDLPPFRRGYALMDGAREVETRELVRRMSRQ